MKVLRFNFENFRCPSGNYYLNMDMDETTIYLTFYEKQPETFWFFPENLVVETIIYGNVMEAFERAFVRMEQYTGLNLITTTELSIL